MIWVENSIYHLFYRPSRVFDIAKQKSGRALRPRPLSLRPAEEYPTDYIKNQIVIRLLKKLHMRGVEERGTRRTFHVRRSDEL